MRAVHPSDRPAGGITRASALPAVALHAAPPTVRAPSATAAPAPAASTAGDWLHLLAPLRSRAARVLAFDAAVLGALLSFVTELLALGAGPAAVDGGRAMLLAALLLTAGWVRVLGADVRRLFTLLRRWR